MPSAWIRSPLLRSALAVSTSLLLPLAIVTAWHLATRLGKVEPVILPPPAKVLATFTALARSGALLEHVLASFARIAKGFAVGSALGITVGVLSGTSRPIARLLNPTISFVRTIPIYAWIPMLILWFGIGETSKIVAITLGVAFPVHLSTEEGIHNVDVKYVELARLLKLSDLHLLRTVVIPAALPFIVTGVRLGLARAWMVVVVAELIAATRGLGYLISDGRQLFQPDVMIVGMLTIGLAGLTFDRLIARLEEKALRWRVRFEDYREASL